MIRTIRLLLTGLILCLAYTACEKEYSEESGGAATGGGGSTTGTAVYTLAGAPGACATPIINGVYIAGTALNASNTVILTVDVTTVGTYAVSSGTVNGITFSGSGSFIITGPQIITLTGSGTPAVAGTFSYEHGANGCSFPISVQPVVTGPVAVGTLDCASATLAGVYTQGIDLTSANTVSIPVNVTIAGSYSISSITTNGCSFSGSGTLTLGAHTIVLTGSGIPVNSGPISFPVSLGTSNCSFPITFLPGTPPPTDYFRCKINGVLTNFNANLDGDITPLLLPNSVAVSGYPTVGSTEYLDVTVNSVNPIVAGTYLHPLGLSFSTSRYVDPTTGLGWQPADLSSPAFSVKITSITSTRVIGTFSGQYKDQEGTGTNSKQITAGEFSVSLP